MSTVEEKVSKSPAGWEEYPDHEKFWDAYVDLFWGNEATDSFGEMLEQDIEWLKKAYLQNNESLTKLENDYINDRKRADYKYEENIKDSQIPLRFGGGPVLNLLPKSSAYITDNVRGNTVDRLDKRLELGGKQAERIVDYAGKFSPNKSKMAEMEYLRQLGTEGQNLRQGMPTTTQKMEDSPGFWETTGDVVDIGTGLMDIYETGSETNIWSSMGKGFENLWNLF